MDRQPGGQPPTDSRISLLIWIGSAVIGIVALCGLIFSLSQLFKSPVSSIPTSVPQSDSREIELTSTFSLSAESGSFTIWGVPVTKGVICSRGEVYDLEYINLSPNSEELTDLMVKKLFICEDASGGFYIDLEIDIFETGTSGDWQIVGGDGEYQQLTGSGTVKGVYLDEDLVVDTFTGEVKVGQ
jgi:hypothetical protein